MRDVGAMVKIRSISYAISPLPHPQGGAVCTHIIRLYIPQIRSRQSRITLLDTHLFIDPFLNLLELGFDQFERD